MKWGPYRDVTTLSELSQLESVQLGGATSLESLVPLARLPKLADLSVSQAHRLEDPASLGAFARLEALEFGNKYAGSDKNVTLPDLAWIRSLTELRTLALPGTRTLDADLSPLLELPNLEQLRLSLRRQYRKQVFELAQTSAVFAKVTAEYEAFDAWRSSERH